MRDTAAQFRKTLLAASRYWIIYPSGIQLLTGQIGTLVDCMVTLK